MMYVSMSRKFNALVQPLCVGRQLYSYICGDAFVGRANPFICDELHLNGIAGRGYVEELQWKIDNSKGSISYLSLMNRGVLMEWAYRNDNPILIKTNSVFCCLFTPRISILLHHILNTFQFPFYFSVVY